MWATNGVRIPGGSSRIGFMKSKIRESNDPVKYINLHYLQITLSSSFYSIRGVVTFEWKDIWSHPNGWGRQLLLNITPSIIGRVVFNAYEK